MGNRVKFSPGSPCHWPRRELQDAVLSGARKSSAVLLFGGRRAGKTSLLMQIADALGERKYDVRDLSDAEIGVYVDLLRLDPNAGPREFFSSLAQAAENACLTQIFGYSVAAASGRPNSRSALDDFVSRLSDIQRGCGEVGLNFVFLLDEAKRVLGNRFPRGFQDNLFTLLYGSQADLPGQVSIVFAGSQRLYEFARDETSPIGSRAACVMVSNLPEEAVYQMFMASFSGAPEEQLRLAVEQTLAETGGHAGLTARIIEELSTHDSLEFALQSFGETRYRVSQDSAGLFDNWLASFSTEARAVVERCEPRDAITVPAIASHLNEIGMNRFLASRVLEELQFTGVVNRFGDGWRLVNGMFHSYVRTFDLEASAMEVAKDISETIAGGESESAEFKSTLRFNLFSKKNDEEIEHAVLKTIGGFLNSEGGVLLIGVDDNGNAIGIDSDGFPSADKMMQHLTNLVKERIGIQHARSIKQKIVEVNGSKVLQVLCRRAVTPAYVTHKQRKLLFVRVGPATSELPINEIYSYIKHRFPGQ